MMQHLIASIGIYAATIIGLCAALPVHPVALGGKNAFLFGTVAILSFVVITVSCVCCRRRKKGFEEFKNESASVESNKTEYPIFRALSPESQRSITSANAALAANTSNENLIVDDIDNNNGPISPADLENIENNNAVDYIQNQNEIDIATNAVPVSSSLSSYTRNHILLESPQISTTVEIEPHQQSNKEILEHVIINSNNATAPKLITAEYFPQISSTSAAVPSISSSSSSSAQLNVFPISVQQNQSNQFSNCNRITIDLNDLKNSSNNQQQNEIFSHQTNHFSDESGINKTFILNNVPIDDNSNKDHQQQKQSNSNQVTQHHFEDLRSQQQPTTEFIDEANNCKFSEVLKRDITELHTVEDSSSIKSVSSEKSNEINSVEEALRVLDNAIEGEDLNNSCEEEDDLPDEEFGDNTTNFQNVIRQLLINNGINGVLSNSTISDQTINHNDKSITNSNSSNVKELDSIECIRAEAENLVDSILRESQILAEERRKENELKTISPPNIVQVYSVTDCTFDINKTFSLIKKNSQDSNSNNSHISTSENENDNNKDTVTLGSSNLLSNESPTNPTNDPNSTFVLTPSNQIDDEFFSELLQTQTSTPCIQGKYRIPSDEIILNKNVMQSLFKSDENEVKNAEISVCENDQPLRPLNKTISVDKLEDLLTMSGDNENFLANATYEIKNKTFDVNEKEENNQMDFTYPGDPCTSRQALERDYSLPLIKLDGDDTNSEKMGTITPVNTPIELNYPNDTWDKITKTAMSNLNIVSVKNFETDNATASSSGNGGDDAEGCRSGWFLHPRLTSGNDNNEYENEAVDMEDEANLQLTFETLRKQLAEVLPQPQSIAGLQEYSDEEDDAHTRTFEEYRSPFDGLLSLLLDNNDSATMTNTTTTTTTNPVQNEVFINYKRPLSPILEVSEEETFKTFVLNETKCPDSTSTGCIDTGEAIMGVTKTLMASNDTLFNFEDTLGEKEDVFSPRIPSRSESQANTPVKSSKSIEDNSLGTSDSDTDRGNRLIQQSTSDNVENLTLAGRKSPPKTIEFIDPSNLKQDSNELCSPDQQKTFSEGTSTSTTDRVSSDISQTIDHDTTFTTNTVDDKSCITVIIKDDERISEISEPEWGSTASCGAYELNSLTDVPSLDFNVNNFDKDFPQSFDYDETTKIEDTQTIEMQKEEDDNNEEEVEEEDNLQEDNQESSADNPSNNELDRDHDDSGRSTQASIDEKSNLSNDTSVTSFGNHTFVTDQQQQYQQQQYTPSIINLQKNNSKIKENCTEFLKYEIELSSSQQLKNKKETSSQHQKYNNHHQQQQHQQQQHQKHLHLSDADSDGDVFEKENTDPNIKTNFNNSLESGTISYQKVQMNSQDTVIVDKAKNISSDASEKDLPNRLQDNVYNNQIDIEIMPPIKHQQTITNYSVSDVNGVENQENCVIVADEILGHLSGEEDPWAEPVVNNDNSSNRYNGACSDMISTSFGANEWDSDIDDSHSSEEFMYVRGIPTNNHNSDIKENGITNTKQYTVTRNDSYDDDDDDDDDENIWPLQEEKSPREKKNSADDEISEESSSEFEGEFVPSCWNSMATPVRSALKSPDKSSSESKKRRSVAFKKQRYHSVYEYPRESAPLSPAYSEPYLWNKVSEASLFKDKNHMEEFYDGFTVSSSMRPFHGSQFSALCHTWPTDSDFSWSQVENFGDCTSDNKQLPTYTNIDIKWPQRGENENDIMSQIKSDSDSSKSRPDSGVEISMEMINERKNSLGELRHTKSSLRLPLDQLPAVENLSTITDLDGESSSLSPTSSILQAPSQQQSPLPSPVPSPPPISARSARSAQPLSTFLSSSNHVSQQSRSPLHHQLINENHSNKIDSKPNDLFSCSDSLILPTPSCTGSMDSLSSSSSSERQISFTTFGKRNNSFNSHNDNNRQNNDMNFLSSNNKDRDKIRPSIILIDTESPTPAMITVMTTMTTTGTTTGTGIGGMNNMISTTVTDDVVVFKPDKIKQGDSTDEDSGIESIMKVNKESD